MRITKASLATLAVLYCAASHFAGVQAQTITAVAQPQTITVVASRPTAIAAATPLTLIPTRAPITITESSSLQSGDALARKVGELDAAVFDAYNRCELKAFGDFIATDVEFFHDNAGLMLTRIKVVEATEKHICGKVRRELVTGSLRVYPIKDYGAIAVGEHRFCEVSTNECVGIAKFTNVWRNQAGAWQMTRIFSYDHQPLKR
jgi:Domain of unknown function (DUF4440)